MLVAATIVAASSIAAALAVLTIPMYIHFVGKDTIKVIDYLIEPIEQYWLKS